MHRLTKPITSIRRCRAYPLAVGEPGRRTCQAPDRQVVLLVVVLSAMALTGAGRCLADVRPETMNGPPLLPIPTYEEVGLPPFVMPTGTPSVVPETQPESGAPATDGGQSGGGGEAMQTMLSRSWGAAAQANVEQMGVNAAAVAATCMLESGCNTNAATHGGISGTFQMLNTTYAADIRKAAAENPSLAGVINVSAAGAADPANQAIAAAQDLKTAALRLRASGIENPTVLDTRGAYNFGAGYGVKLAQASDNQTMSSILSSYSAAELRNNGVTPTTTVGQWRQTVTARSGGGANELVLTRS